LLCTILLLAAVPAGAQDWTAITGAEALRSLISGRTLVIEGIRDSDRRGIYRADGTGVLYAWGAEFPRRWEIRGDDQICVFGEPQSDCYRFERNTADPLSYRVTAVSTGVTTLLRDAGPGQDKLVASDGPPDTGRGAAAAPSVEELAQKLANPTNPIMTIGNNFDFVTFQGELPGADDESAFRYLFQTVFPFKLRDGGGSVFLRPAVPLFFNEPVPDGAGGFDEKGVELGDIGFDLSWGQTSATGIVYGGGLVGTLPTATDDALGKDKWSLGPELLFGKVGSWGAVLGLLTHQWDVAGSGNSDVNVTSLTYIYALGIGNGWQIAASPVVSYDHEASSGNELTLPLGIGIAKTSVLAGRPWKFQLQYWNYVEANDVFAPEHLLRFSVSPVVSAPWNAGK
jgi:hypothetical protein